MIMRMKSTVENNVEIRKLLKPVRQRIIAQHYLSYLLRALLVCILLSVLFLIISFLLPWLGVGQICLQTFSAAMPIALLLAWGKQPGLRETAGLLDSRGLKERVSTALELADQESLMAVRQREDTLNQLRTYDWRSHFPWTVPKVETRIIAAAMLILALLFVLPNPQQEQIERQLAINKEIKQQEKKVAAIKKELEKKEKAAPDAQRQEAIKALQELQENLQQSDSLKKALKSLAQAEEQLAVLSEAELKQIENETPKSGVSPHNGKLAPLNGNNDSLLKVPEGGANSGRPGNTRGNSDNLADLQQTAQSIGDARMALLSAANPSNGQLAAAGGNSAASNAGAEQGANAAESSTADSGVAANPTDAPGSSEGGGSSSAAGQPGAGNSGSGSSGNGNQSGGGNQPGNGNGSGSGAGRGSGNGDSSSGRQSSENNSPAGSSFPDMNSREYEKIYDPDNLGISGKTSVVRGKAGNGPQQSMETADPALTPGLLRPYQEVIGHYSQVARESLGRSSVPAGMNEIVKDYFSSLEE